MYRVMLLTTEPPSQGLSNIFLKVFVQKKLMKMNVRYIFWYPLGICIVIDWEKIFTGNNISDRVHVFTIYKELLLFQKANNLKMGKRFQ